MKRLDFIKTLGLGTGGLVVPIPDLIRSKKVKIYDNYVRGLRYYTFFNIYKKIKEGDTLKLVREPENSYDSYAIQIFFEEYKLGYIAAYENIVMSNMMDIGVELQGFVSQIHTKELNYNSLAIEVFADIIVPSPKLLDSIASEQRADDAIDIYRRATVF